jgi:hypothetical protein
MKAKNRLPEYVRAKEAVLLFSNLDPADAVPPRRDTPGPALLPIWHGHPFSKPLSVSPMFPDRTPDGVRSTVPLLFLIYFLEKFSFFFTILLTRLDSPAPSDKILGIEDLVRRLNL